MKNIVKEIWKAIPNYEGHYEVSNLGRVRGLDRTRVDKRGRAYRQKGKILSPKDTNGYREVGLSKSSSSKYVKIHRLVAIVFIPNPENKPCVNHLDADKSNNEVSNLQWATYAENSKHAQDMGLIDNFGENNYYAKLTNSEVITICDLLDKLIPNSVIAKQFSVDPETVYNIKVGKTWSHLTGRKR